MSVISPSTLPVFPDYPVSSGLVRPPPRSLSVLTRMSKATRTGSLRAVYVPKVHDAISHLAGQEQASLKEWARRLGIDVGVLQSWRHKHGGLQEAYIKGLHMQTLEVTSALVKRAKGYNYTVVTKESGAGTNGPIDKETVREEHIPADVGAIKLFLKNVEPDKWNNEKGEGNVGPNVQIVLDATDRNI